MRSRRFELAAWEVYECGKPWAEADADVAEAIDFCEFYAREMIRLAEPRHRDASGETNYHRAHSPRRGRGHPALELSPGDSHRHDRGRARGGQHGHPQAGRAIAGHHLAACPRARRSRAAPRRAQLPARPGRGSRPGPGQSSRHRPRRLHRLARRRPFDQSPGGRGQAGPESPQAGDRRDGGQERDRDRRRCRSRRGRRGRDPQRIRLFGPKMLGLLARDRARRNLRRVPGAVGRGRPGRQGRAGRRSRDRGRPGDRRRRTQAHPRIPADRRDRGPRRLPGGCGPARGPGVLRRPDDRRRCPARCSRGPGGDLRPGPGRPQGEGPGRRLANRQRHRLCLDRRPLFTKPGQHRARAPRVSRGQSLHQPRDHRGPGRPPAVRRVQALGHRHQGRRAGLLARVSADAMRHREHDAQGVRAEDTAANEG